MLWPKTTKQSRLKAGRSARVYYTAPGFARRLLESLSSPNGVVPIQTTVSQFHLKAQNINRIVILPTGSWRGGAGGAFWGKNTERSLRCAALLCSMLYSGSDFPPPGNEDDFLFEGFLFPDE